MGQFNLDYMIDSLRKDKWTQIAVILYASLTFWWVILYIYGATEGIQNLLFGAVYGTTMSLYGSILGFKISQRWGGAKSLMGKAILVLSLGLFAQFFGQAVFSIYNIFLGVEIPYPSLADLGYFGNIPLYLIGISLLAKASGIRVSLRSFQSQLQAIFIPLIILGYSYFHFLSGYELDWTNPLTIFLDFGYPLGQALYVSIAILTFSLSRGILGGVMKNKILIIICAFIFQYLADFNFLYQNSRGTWYNGGYGDYLYLVAYFAMTIAILQLKMSSVKSKLT